MGLCDQLAGGNDEKQNKKERKGSKVMGSKSKSSPDEVSDICSHGQPLAGSTGHSAALQHGGHFSS